MIDLIKNREIVLIDSSEIIRVVCSALSKIDPRLIDHGARVGFIAEAIRRNLPDGKKINGEKLYILSLLHDVGAYKTNEIDDMVHFETVTVFDHSLYGYLFLKNTTHLADYAEAILYHHTDFSSPEIKGCRRADYAELIHLADRADILINDAGISFSAIKALSGSKFNPDYVKAFFRAEEKEHISDKIRNGGYKAENALIEKSLHISSDEILDFLKLLVYAIDFRSPYTVTHTADTTIISLETGKLLGISENDTQALYLGAFLHDIGKIAIPNSILEKPGKLTAEEYDIVKRHIPEGEQILRGIVSDEICDIALRHHEKLDGSGYSLGLTAASLTLPQRILAVSDIMSALSQRRSYKEPFPKETVLSILNDMKNTGKLCPRVVDTVCLHYDEILNNTEMSHDPVKVLYSNLRCEYDSLAKKL